MLSGCGGFIYFQYLVGDPFAGQSSTDMSPMVWCMPFRIRILVRNLPTVGVGFGLIIDWLSVGGRDV